MRVTLEELRNNCRKETLNDALNMSACGDIFIFYCNDSTRLESCSLPSSPCETLTEPKQPGHEQPWQAEDQVQPNQGLGCLSSRDSKGCWYRCARHQYLCGLSLLSCQEVLGRGQQESPGGVPVSRSCLCPLGF